MSPHQLVPTGLVVARMRTTLGLALFCTGITMINAAGHTAGRQCPLGHLAADLARAARRLDRQRLTRGR